MLHRKLTFLSNLAKHNILDASVSVLQIILSRDQLLGAVLCFNTGLEYVFKYGQFDITYQNEPSFKNIIIESSLTKFKMKSYFSALSAGAEEYIDSTSAEEEDPSNETTG